MAKRDPVGWTKKRDPLEQTWIVVQCAQARKRLPSARSAIRYFEHNPQTAVRYEQVRRAMRPSGLRRKLREQVN